MDRPARLTARSLLVLAASVLWAPGCERPPVAPEEPRYARAGGGGPSVDYTDPPGAERDTTLSVVIVGSGFDRGSQARFLRDGVYTGKIVTNSTSYLSPTQLLANITIAADADPTTYDIEVTTGSGKKGVGADLFAVLLMIEEMGLLPGFSTAIAYGTVGTGDQAVGHNHAGPEIMRTAFFWSVGGGMRALPAFRPSFHHYARSLAVGSGGELYVVGYASDSATGDTPHAINWFSADGGTSWTVDTLPRHPAVPGRYEAYAVARASDGAVLTVGYGMPGGGSGFRAMRWSTAAPGVTDLHASIASAPDCGSNIARDVNEAGVIVGSRKVVNGCGTDDAFVWVPPTPSATSGTTTALPLPSGASLRLIYAVGINGRGDNIVGYASEAKGAGNTRPLRWWRDGNNWRVQFLPLGKALEGWAYDVNSSDDAAGTIERSSGRYFAAIWRAGTLVTLPTPAGFTDAIAYGISDRGPGEPTIVVGRAWNPNGNSTTGRALRWMLF